MQPIGLFHRINAGSVKLGVQLLTYEYLWKKMIHTVLVH